MQTKVQRGFQKRVKTFKKTSIKLLLKVTVSAIFSIPVKSKQDSMEPKSEKNNVGHIWHDLEHEL